MRNELVGVHPGVCRYSLLLLVDKGHQDDLFDGLTADALFQESITDVLSIILRYDIKVRCDENWLLVLVVSRKVIEEIRANRTRP